MILRFRDGEIKALVCIEGLCELYDVDYEETPSGEGVVHVAKLCLDIPDSLYEWLKEIARELATTPETFIERLLWQYYSLGQATLRAQCKGEQVKTRNFERK